jgi:cbb3-type cytochrome oxidase cytochrome c subunit
MNHGPLIFLGVLVTFVASWWGLIFSPQLQIGSQQSTEVDGSLYPTRRAGVALQGREVYVANGCVHCHSQQLRQEGYTFNVNLTSVGTNGVKVAALLSQIAPGVNAGELIANVSDKSPQTILSKVSLETAEDAQKRFKAIGAAANPVFIPLGVDISAARRWGVRRSVGADYLFDDPVQVGNSRLGPDLANYGNRAPSTDFILAHLFDSRTTMPGSLMPAYRYLFETRLVGKQPSPNALKLTGKFAPPAGFEVVPTTQALQLVDYLRSLRVDTALFEGPLPQLAPPAAAGTNAPGTNAPIAAAPKP